MTTFISYSGTASQIDVPSAIQDVTITAIPADFVKGNAAATYVRIPDSVTSIASGAFSNCAALKTIVIGSGVTSIDATAFQSLTAFEGCYYKGTPTQWAALNFTTFGDSVAYYSETTPTDTEHYYWHYDTDNLTPVMY